MRFVKFYKIFKTKDLAKSELKPYLYRNNFPRLWSCPRNVYTAHSQAKDWTTGQNWRPIRPGVAHNGRPLRNTIQPRPPGLVCGRRKRLSKGLRAFRRDKHHPGHPRRQLQSQQGQWTDPPRTQPREQVLERSQDGTFRLSQQAQSRHVYFPHFKPCPLHTWITTRYSDLCPEYDRQIKFDVQLFQWLVWLIFVCNWDQTSILQLNLILLVVEAKVLIYFRHELNYTGK